MVALAGVLSACSGVPVQSTDAGALLDSSLYVGAPPCEAPNGESLETIGDRFSPASTQVYTSSMLWRARATPSGGVIVLHTTHPTSVEGSLACTHVVSSFDGSGHLGWSREIASLDPCFPQAADFVFETAGIEVAGIDLEGRTSSRWRATIALDGTLITGRTVEEVIDDLGVMRLSGLAAVPESGSEAAAIYFIRDGDLLVTRGIDDEHRIFSLGDDGYRISATRSDDGRSTCIVVRHRQTGRLSLLRLAGDIVMSNELVLEAGASFNPVPIASSERCIVPYFAPDETHPTAGSVRVFGAADTSILGWRGVAPLGLAMVGENRLALAAPDPEWPGQIDVWWIEPSPGRCSVPSAALVTTVADYGGPLGSVQAVATDDGPRVILGGLTGVGEVAIARPAR